MGLSLVPFAPNNIWGKSAEDVMRETHHSADAVHRDTAPDGSTAAEKDMSYG